MVEWLTNYGQIIGFFVQMVYYLVIAAVAVYAVLLFKRLVNFNTGAGKEGEDEDETTDTGKGKKAVKVENFVD